MPPARVPLTQTRRPEQKTRPKKKTPSQVNRVPPVFDDVYADAPSVVAFAKPDGAVTEITDVAAPVVAAAAVEA